MIRNVVVGRLRAPADEEQGRDDRARLRAALDGIEGLDLPGRVAVHTGLDLGLREGGWSFTITSDWTDADAYRGYDLDEEHNRIRREGFAPICDEIARVQIDITPHPEPAAPRPGGRP